MMTTKLPVEFTPELKRKWVKALRSGKYTKTEGCLKRFDGTYCALGILCDISGLGYWDNTEPLEHSEEEFLTYKIKGSKEKANQAISHLFKIGLDLEGTIIDLNDSLNWTFSEMADWIEENL